MNGYDSSEDQQPVTWINGHAIYAAHFLVVVFVASMLVTTILMLAHAERLLGLMAFNSRAAYSGAIWQVFTYGLVNRPSLMFAFEMLMIVWFGREIERYFGRKIFLTLYASIYLLSPLLLLLVGRWVPQGMEGESCGFALFIAFATLYPDTPIFFTLLAKWVAWILVAIYALVDLSQRDWHSLLILGCTCSFAFSFVRYQQGRITLPSFHVFRKKPKLRVLTSEELTRTPVVSARRDDSMAEIDALLDKIAQSGISSLTAKERARLESARNDISRRDRRS